MAVWPRAQGGLNFSMNNLRMIGDGCVRGPFFVNGKSNQACSDDHRRGRGPIQTGADFHLRAGLIFSTRRPSGVCPRSWVKTIFTRGVAPAASAAFAWPLAVHAAIPLAKERPANTHKSVFLPRYFFIPVHVPQNQVPASKFAAALGAEQLIFAACLFALACDPNARCLSKANRRPGQRRPRLWQP